MQPVFALLLVLLAASTLLSTDPVRPGDAALASDRLVAGTDTLVIVVMHEDEGQLAGFVTLQTLRRGDELLRIEETWRLGESLMHRDSFAVAAASLAPRYHTSTEGSRAFEGDAFYANSMDLVLGSLPLTEGFAAQLALVSGADGDGDTDFVADVEVLAREEMQTADGGSCSAWRVLFEADASQAIYWISTDTGLLVQYAAPAEGFGFVRLRGCPVPS